MTLPAIDRFPDGIDAKSVPDEGSWWRGSSWRSLIVLGTLMILVASGLLGGAPRPWHRIATADAELAVRMPARSRNGEFFETEIIVTARRPIAKLVIGVTPGLWHNVTVNTFIPAPTEESFDDGAFRFDFGPVAAGDTRVVKIDSQINPQLWGGTRGTISVSDDKRELAALPLSMRVLP